LSDAIFGKQGDPHPRLLVSTLAKGNSIVG
jgi:hypothetical protein